MQRKEFYGVLSVVLLLSGLTSAYSKDINRYIMIHKNRKNESIVKPSPLGSGYDQTTAVEFQFRQNTSEAMKRRVKMVFPPAEEPIEEEDLEGEVSEIFGKGGRHLFEDGDTTIEELEEETFAAIENQKKKEEIEAAEQRKQNIASYAASVEAKIKRDREAAIAAALKANEKEEQTVWEEGSEPTEEVEEEYDENSIVLVTDSSGKISLKKPVRRDNVASDTASATAAIASGTATVASSTAPVASATAKVKPAK